LCSDGSRSRCVGKSLQVLKQGVATFLVPDEAEQAHVLVALLVCIGFFGLNLSSFKPLRRHDDGALFRRSTSSHLHPARLRIPQKVQQPFQRFQAQIKLISRTIECTPENSSDLERPPGARSAGDDFSGVHSMFEFTTYRGVKIRLFTLMLHLLGSGVALHVRAGHK
jgi:hypothetical protein